MPSNHISNTDYHEGLEYGFYVDYEALKLQKLKLQDRCAQHRRSLEEALSWLKKNTDISQGATISNLADSNLWSRLKKDATGLE
tara:strand:- start:121 stop:372 length:252 start_codon:yes stop_codon:yes gene_type:complete